MAPKVPSRSRVIRLIADNDGITLEEIADKLFEGNRDICGQLLDEIKKQKFIETTFEILNPDTFTLVYAPGERFEMMRRRFHYHVTALGLEYLREHRLEAFRDWAGFIRSLLPF